MKVAVLTSSRADYSIYFPLLRALANDTYFELSIIAFGTHLSEKHGFTRKKIEEDGFEVRYSLDTAPSTDSAVAIACSMADTMKQFSNIWSQTEFDLVFCLGDRYEMFAACASGVPFNLRFAHIHGGEQTLGAIDDAFRHGITHMSAIHFTAAEPYRQRVVSLKNSEEHVYNVGSLSFDNLKNLRLLTISEFEERFNIDLRKPSILITFHPETVSYQHNLDYVEELIRALSRSSQYQQIITMPNADTMGNAIRERLLQYTSITPNAIAVESFGTVGYLSCMKYCSFMLGNTSSGFIEAAFFPKYVINLGNRQLGRIITPNIVNCKITESEIVDAINGFESFKLETRLDVYGQGDAAEKIVKILKTL